MEALFIESITNLICNLHLTASCNTIFWLCTTSIRSNALYTPSSIIFLSSGSMLPSLSFAVFELFIVASIIGITGNIFSAAVSTLSTNVELYKSLNLPQIECTYEYVSM